MRCMVLILMLALGGQAGKPPLTKSATPALLPAEITKSVQLHAGTYHLSAPLRVHGANIVLDGNGATLIGSPGFSGILISKGQNVAVKNIRVKGCRWGVEADDTAGLRLLAVDASANWDARPTPPIAAADPEPEFGGGGILLRNVRDAAIQGSVANVNWNGVTLAGCAKVLVYESDLSHNDGTGIRLWDSNDSEVRDCLISFTGANYTDDADGQNAPTAILVEHGSSHNRFLRNVAVHSGGRGIEVTAGGMRAVPADEALQNGLPAEADHPGIEATDPADGNRFESNDASFARGAAISLRLATGTQLLANVAAYSEIGFDLGYSRNTTVKGNEIVGNRDCGVRLASVWGDQLESNVFVRDYGATLALACSNAVPAGGDTAAPKVRSGGIGMFDNGFIGYARGIKLEDCYPVTVQANRFYGVASAGLEEIADVTGKDPLWLHNTVETHDGPILAASNGNAAFLPGLLDPLGGISVADYDKAKEAIVQGSLTGKFEGEEYEIGRLAGAPPVDLDFPPRAAPFVRVLGAGPGTGAFIARIGDSSIARRRTASASGGDGVENPVSRDWDTPGRAWTPNDQAGQWWQVDLGRLVTIYGFGIAANVTNPDAFWPKFHIAVSETGDFAGEEKIVGAEANWSRRPGPVRVYQIAPIRTRYVRIIGDVGKSGVQLQQFAVYRALS